MSFKKKPRSPINRQKLHVCLILILGALVGRAPPKICSISIYQTWSADCKRSYGGRKNYFEVTHSNWKVSFKKKPRRNIKHKKNARIPYVWFWVHWLAEHTPKCVKYQFTKLGWLTARDPKEGAKYILKFFFLC